MNLNVYLEDELAVQLANCAQSVGQSKNSIIREALKSWIHSHYNHQWSDDIMQFTGLSDLPAFESYRHELTGPTEDPLA